MADVSAVILARGLARRMREGADTPDLSAVQRRAADAGLKAMMPVGHDQGGRPFLDYILSGLADAGFARVGLVIGPEHDAIRRRYDQEVVPTRLTLSWLVQDEPRGTADAVLAAETWTARSPFVVLNADNLYPTSVLRALRALDGPGLPVFRRDALLATSNIPADRLASFALLHVDRTGRLTGIEEKPGAAAIEAAGPEGLISMNLWRFDVRIFSACRDVPRSSRGEFELPMAVGLAVARGVPFQTIPGEGEVLDLSRRQDVAAVSARLAGRPVAL